MFLVDIKWLWGFICYIGILFSGTPQLFYKVVLLPEIVWVFFFFPILRVKTIYVTLWELWDAFEVFTDGRYLLWYNIWLRNR